MDIDDTPNHFSPDISNVEMEDVAERAPAPEATNSLVPAPAPALSDAGTVTNVSDGTPQPAPALTVADIHSFGSGETQGSRNGKRSSSRLRRSRSRSILNRPDILLGYAQVVFNASVLLVVLYVIFSVLWTVRKDVAEKVRDYELGAYMLTRLSK